MEETLKKIKEYLSNVRNASFELNRDPYMALVDCSLIRRSLSGEDDMSEPSKRRIERDLRTLEEQATFDWNRTICY